MEEKSKIEVKIDLPTLKVSLSTEVPIEKVDDVLEKFLESVSKSNKKISKLVDNEALQQKTSQPQTLQIIPTISQQGVSSLEDPISLIALRTDTDLQTLKSSQILGVKDSKIQILKPQKFSPAEAILVLTLCYELGLKRQSIGYEELKTAYQDSGIKGNTPFRMAINNIKFGGLIDKSKYDSSQEISLNSKGQTKAIENLKKAIS